MTDCIPAFVRFPSCKGRLVKAGYSGDAIIPEGGAELLHQADRVPGLTERAARLGDMELPRPAMDAHTIERPVERLCCSQCRRVR